MGLPLFSSSSYDKPKTVYVEKVINLPNPNPNNYKILQFIEENGWLLVRIRYLDCTNYEGEKVLLYKNCTMGKLQKQKSIDPHFTKNKKYYSPFARFEPTTEGWKTAIKIMNYE